MRSAGTALFRHNRPDSGENPMLTGTIWKELLIFFFPLLGGTFFQLLYNTVDALVVGRFVGMEALSAVGGTTAQLINTFVGFFIGITSGVTVIVSQYYGADRKEDVNKAVHTGMALALACGILLTVVVGLFAYPMITAMNTPREIRGLSALYLRIYALGMIGNMVYNVGASIQRGIGDSRHPFYSLVAGAVTNIVLDLVFVLVFHWGVAGASLATIISQYVSAVLEVHSLTHTKEECCRLRFREIRIERPYIEQILRIGIPAALQSLMYNISNILIQASINSFGTATVAGWTIWGRIDSLFWMISNSLGIATTTMAGQNFGAGKFRRVRKTARQAGVLLTVFTVSLGSLFYFFSQPFVSFFTEDPQVIRIGIQMARFMGPSFVTFILIEILADTLRGMGDAVMPTVITVVGVCVLRVVWILSMLPGHRSITTVMFSYPFSWTVSSIWYLIYYEYYVRKHDIRTDRAAA